jgi:TrmH family RNA methyltransferase
LKKVSEEAALAEELDRNGIEVIAVPEQVFRSMSPVTTPSGIAAIVRRGPSSRAVICGRKNCFVLVATDVQDPGNLGSLVRVAEAGGMTGVLVCGASAHPFSWKAVRGSMGSALRIPLALDSTPESAVDCLKDRGVRIVAAVPRGGEHPDEVNWSGPAALLLGGEGPGLSGDLVARSDQSVTIPMAPPVESLNVAVAAAILVYAARRQRT